jgi:hypothetical protein
VLLVVVVVQHGRLPDRTRRRLKVFTMTFAAVFPVLISMAVVVMCAIYAFAVIGMEVFYGTYAIASQDTIAHFDSFGAAALVNFQMLIGTNYNGA